MFYINEHMDEGDIISQKLLEIKSEDYISDVLNNEYKLTNEIIGENYGLLLTGKVNRIKQDNNNASYCSKRIPSDGKIEWCNLAKDIYNFIRAQSNPYPGAFIYDENMNKVYIERAEVFTYEYYGILGRILKVEKDKLLVCCKGGAIYIKPILSNEDLRKKFKFGQSLT